MLEICLCRFGDTWTRDCHEAGIRGLGGPACSRRGARKFQEIDNHGRRSPRGRGTCAVGAARLHKRHRTNRQQFKYIVKLSVHVSHNANRPLQL